LRSKHDRNERKSPKRNLKPDDADEQVKECRVDDKKIFIFNTGSTA
jgi:hypothetical protein